MFLSRHVANSVLQACRARGIKDITPLKLQKLIYFLHGWHLAFTDKPAVSERFLAWRYGPVLDSIYREFRHFAISAALRLPIMRRNSTPIQVKILHTLLETITPITKNLARFSPTFSIRMGV